MRPITLLVCAGCAFGSGVPDPADLPEVVTWDDHVGYLMQDVCASCHGRTHRIEGYDFTTYDAVVCDWGDIREQLAGNQHPPGGAPRFDGWELAIVHKWASDGFAASMDASGAPLFPAAPGCAGRGD